MTLAMILKTRPFPMSTLTLLELFGAFMGACFALWLVSVSLPAPALALPAPLAAWSPTVRAYVRGPGRLASLGLLLLRLSIGVLMIHHGPAKLAAPPQFAHTYVASLHLPFPLFFAYVAGFSELIGSWLVIFGLLTPLGALALSGTMTVAAYQHISTAGLNIYVLELVMLYLGGSLALLLNGPGRFSFDAGIVPAVLDGFTASLDSQPMPTPVDGTELAMVAIPVDRSNRA
jgi:putative oxidoreductase